MSISQLPPETLSLIFRFVSYAIPHHLPFTGELEGSKEPDYMDTEQEDTGISSTWVKITHVSRYWREVAVNETSLWTTISTKRGRSCAQVFLKRSGSRAITLHLERQRYSGPAKRDILFWADAISRAHTLHITGSLPNWQECLMNSDAPSLSTFTTYATESEAEGEAFQLSPDSFYTNPDALCVLHICSVSDLNFPAIANYTTLTTLKVGMLSNNWFVLADWPLHDILDTLSQLHNLVSLTLIGLMMDTDEDTHDRPTHTIRLSRLQHMRFEYCETSTLLALFNAITTPTDAKVRIIAEPVWWTETYGNTTTIAATKFLEVLGHHFSTPAWQNIRTVMVVSSEYVPDWLRYQALNGSEHINIMAWRQDVDLHHLFHRLDEGEMQRLEPDFCLHASCDNPGLDMCYAFYTIEFLRLLHPLPIRSLCLLLDEGLSETFMRWNSESFPSLCHMMLCGRLFTEIISMMYMHCHASPTLINPELKTFTFLFGDEGSEKWYRMTCSIKDAGDEDFVEYPCVELLERLLKMYSNGGRALQVFVEECLLEGDFFDSMADKSVLQRLPLL